MHLPPRLSLIIGARNDQFMGNFTWRLETALNYLAANLKRLGRLEDVEVVVTDWGSEVPLHSVLSLNWSARRIVRFILVPPPLAQELQGDSEFPIVLAQNAAVRRSRGGYISQVDSDILFTPEFLAKLFEILDGHQSVGEPLERALLFCGRQEISWWVASRNPDISEIEFVIQKLARFLPESAWVYVNDPGICAVYNKRNNPLHAHDDFYFPWMAFAMLHRNAWHESRGYNERLIYRGAFDIDFALRIRQKYVWVDLGFFGVTLFHLNHHPPISLLQSSPRKVNRMNATNFVFNPNDEGWGLGKYELQEVCYKADAQEGETTDEKAMHPVSLIRKLGLILEIISEYYAMHWSNRARFIGSQLKGQPPTRWFSILGRLWAEYRHLQAIRQSSDG
jgi:glycosyltransferase involved in cell wall biosynthesis